MPAQFLLFLLPLLAPFALAQSTDCSNGALSCECVRIQSTPNTIIPTLAGSITIEGSGLAYCIFNPTACLFNFLTSSEGGTSRSTGATIMKTTATKTSFAIFGADCADNPVSCDKKISIALDPATRPTSLNTGPLYGYITCSSPTMVGARLYWYTQPVAGSPACDPAAAQACKTIYTHYPDDPAGILSGENTDPGHISRIIGTDRAPIIGHIGSLVAATPTQAEASGIGLAVVATSTFTAGTDATGAGGGAAVGDATTTDSSTGSASTTPSNQVTFTFTSGAAPTTLCSASNSTVVTGCMPASCSWVDPEAKVSKSSEALINGNEITCPFVVWPHRAGKVYLKVCVKSPIRFNTRNDTTLLSTTTMGDSDEFCFLWNNGGGEEDDAGSSSSSSSSSNTVTMKTSMNSLAFNISETWSDISRKDMNVYGGQITYIYGNGFDVRVHLDEASSNASAISTLFSDETTKVGYRIKLQMSRFILYVNAHPISASGLLFATPQWVEAPVRLKVVVEKLIMVGSLFTTCPVQYRSDASRCVWTTLPRQGAATAAAPPAPSSAAPSIALDDIYLNIIGSCGNVNAPR